VEKIVALFHFAGFDIARFIQTFSTGIFLYAG